MARFLDPPPPKPLIPEEKIPKVYKSMRFKVFLGAFLGYSAYYLVRKNLSLAAPGMIAEGLITKAQIGVSRSELEGSVYPALAGRPAGRPDLLVADPRYAPVLRSSFHQ